MSNNQLLYGLANASHDFSNPDSLGKNIFTNAFPISIIQYLAIKKQLKVPVIQACFSPQSGLGTSHELKDWKDIIQTSPDTATFLFESVFNEYRKYTHSSNVNKSDIVIADSNGTHKRAFEVKLVVVPNSATKDRAHDKQSCEIVVRPPSIEQLAFSIASTYGLSNRSKLNDIITDALVDPMDYKWSDQSYMLAHLENIKEAALNIAIDGLKDQTPFAITAVWRTKGQSPALEDNAFDAFVWTDLAFIQLFTDKLCDDLSDKKPVKQITRPVRSLIWLISALFDYSAQKTLNFNKHHSQITYGAQTDKAGAFAGDAPYRHLRSDEFITPRITIDELESLLHPDAFEYLMPERRLDAAIYLQHLINQAKI